MYCRTKSLQLKAIFLVSTAVAAPLTPLGAQTSPQSSSSADQPPAEGGAGDIIVTATKRSESSQKVPISLQALSPETLSQHKVAAIDDYVKLLPSVSVASLGPGQSNLFFRGISTGSSGFAPSAGLYLDETPVQSAGPSSASLDLHVYDIARVEALAGPQGTLFGANSLSGTLRIITNKPEIGKFSGAIDVQGTKFGKGDFGGMVEGFVNLPLTDNIALRVVGYYKKEGGYIDVVPGTVRYTLGDNDPTNDIIKNNASQVADDVNSIEVYGARAALGIELDDNWTITPQIMAQRQKSNGAFLWDPKAGDLAVRTYSPAKNNDGWYLASLTIEGKIGNFDLIYSGSYLDRQAYNEADYTYYSVAYDSAPGYTKFPLPGGGFLDPTQRFFGDVTSHRETSELRLSSPADMPLFFTVGGFYQSATAHSINDYLIPGVSKLPPATLSVPPVRGDNIYLIDTRNVSKDYALFGEASYRITSNLTLTGGLRWFKSKQRGEGFTGIFANALRGGCSVPLTAPCITNRSNTESDGETHKVNLTWQVDNDRMLYATYSTGFRVGGPNSVPGVNNYRPDTLSNYEIGFKTFWLDRKLRINGAVYYDEWKGIQYRLATPGANGLSATYNAGDARIYGAEVDFTAVMGNFTLSGSGAYTDARLSTDFCSLQSRANPNPFPTCSDALGNLAAPKGTRLANQPRFKASLSGRYEFATGNMDNFLMGTVNTQTGSRNSLGRLESQLLGDSAGFTTVDFSIGTRFNNSTIELFIQNAFDERGELSRGTFCQITICGPVALRYYTVKPQFFGIKFGQRFN